MGDAPSPDVSNADWNNVCRTDGFLLGRDEAMSFCSYSHQLPLHYQLFSLPTSFTQTPPESSTGKSSQGANDPSMVLLIISGLSLLKRTNP